MSAPGPFIATIEFASGEPHEVGHLAVEDTESWPILTRQLCAFAGAGSRPAAGLQLRLRVPDPDSTHRGYLLDPPELMVYIKRCVKYGSFGLGFTNRAVLEVVNTAAESDDEDIPDRQVAQTPAPDNTVSKIRPAETAYQKARPQALFWTRNMVTAYQTVPPARRESQFGWKTKPDDLVGMFIIESHVKHLRIVCKQARTPVHHLSLCRCRLVNVTALQPQIDVKSRSVFIYVTVIPGTAGRLVADETGDGRVEGTREHRRRI